MSSRRPPTSGSAQTPYFTFGGVNDLTSKFGLKWTFGSGGQSASQHPGSVTMSLGASGTDLTAIEQASTFATLADGGVYHLPHVIAASPAARSGHYRHYP